MEDKTVVDGYGIKKRKFVISAVVATSVILSGYVFSIGYGVLLSEKIYTGILIEGIDVGGLSKEEARNVLEKKYKENFNMKTITIKAKGQVEHISYEKSKTMYDFNKAIDEAYNIGRSGTMMEQFVNRSFIKTADTNIQLAYSYDKNIIMDSVDSLSKKIFQAPTEYDLKIDSPKNVILKTGHHGVALKKEEAIKKVEEIIKKGNDGITELEITNLSSKPIEIEDVMKKVIANPTDATTAVVDNKIKIIPEVFGREIEKSSVEAIISNLEEMEDQEVNLPVKFTTAKLKEADVKALLLRDELGGFSTQFYTGDVNNNNRKHNIILAASKLDGKLLGAGKVFSFNDTVGPRSSGLGYKTAHSYVLGKITESAGGGICQVSSTLYNAVLFADVGIVDRNNHIYTVAYVPKGRDAAVSYDDCDFKFKNTTKYPLKITCWVTDDNQITFSLIGTNESPGKTFDFRYETLSVTEPWDKISYDSSMIEGSREVTDAGMTGYVVKAYKIIKQEGEEDREVSLGTSEYLTLPRRVVVGTRKP